MSELQAENQYHIIQVSNKKQLKDFIGLNRTLYQDSANFVQPLNLHMEMMIGTLKDSEKFLFLASFENQPVARLATKRHQHGDEDIVHFGFFECHPKHQLAAKLLFEEAHQKFPHLTLRGPYNFRMEDPYIGVLVDGFDTPPYIFLSYNHQEYDEMLKAAGLEKAIDLLTYKIQVTECPKTILKIAERSRKRSGVKTRWLNPKKLKDEVKTISAIFNEALSDNWGFEEITDDQLDEMYMIFKFFIDPRLVVFLQKETENGWEDIGCAIMLPNLNHFVQPCFGKLKPSLLFNLLFNKKDYDSARAYAMGVRKKFQGSGAVCQIIEALYARSLELGLREVEISWVLENNKPMTEISKSMGGVYSKTYRVYDRPPVS